MSNEKRYCDGDLVWCRYSKGMFIPIHVIQPNTNEEERQKERRKWYESGMRSYIDKNGHKLTLRPDGTEYFEKWDLPA
jgi:hypothetical protein